MDFARILYKIFSTFSSQIILYNDSFKNFVDLKFFDEN